MFWEVGVEVLGEGTGSKGDVCTERVGEQTCTRNKTSPSVFMQSSFSTQPANRMFAKARRANRMTECKKQVFFKSEVKKRLTSSRVQIKPRAEISGGRGLFSTPFKVSSSFRPFAHLGRMKRRGRAAGSKAHTVLVPGTRYRTTHKHRQSALTPRIFGLAPWSLCMPFYTYFGSKRTRTTGHFHFTPTHPFSCF